LLSAARSRRASVAEGRWGCRRGWIEKGRNLEFDTDVAKGSSRALPYRSFIVAAQ